MNKIWSNFVLADTTIFETCSYGFPSKIQNPAILHQGGPDTLQWSHLSRFCDSDKLPVIPRLISTNIFVPGYLGIMVTRQQQFCCIFAATKDKFDYFLKKLFYSSTWHTYHHNSSLFLNRHKNIHGLDTYFLGHAVSINELTTLR